MTELSFTQQRALLKLIEANGVPKSAYELCAGLATLRALCDRGLVKDVTPWGSGGMFSPRTHYKFIKV